MNWDRAIWLADSVLSQIRDSQAMHEGSQTIPVDHNHHDACITLAQAADELAELTRMVNDQIKAYSEYV